MMTTMAAPTYMAAGTTTMAAPVQYVQGAQMYGGQVVETMAAPQVTYAQAPMETVSYAAAPTYAQAYAAPTVVETMAAPQYVETVQTVAAPQYTYVDAAPVAAPQYMVSAPQYTTQVPSYVAPPVMQMPQTMPYTQQTITAPPAPIQPRKLTEGIPTPDQISQQKAGYAAALDKQLKEAVETVQKETQIEKEMIKFTAEKTIALYNMQVDEKLTEAVALADEQATFALLELNKAKVERNLQLTAQANGLVMDYQMKAVQTELAQKQYAFSLEYSKAENALAEQYNAQVAKANTGTTYSVPAAAVR